MPSNMQHTYNQDQIHPTDILSQKIKTKIMLTSRAWQEDADKALQAALDNLVKVQREEQAKAAPTEGAGDLPSRKKPRRHVSLAALSLVPFPCTGCKAALL